MSLSFRVRQLRFRMCGASVSCAEFHPSEPWLLLARRDGSLVIWDHAKDSERQLCDFGLPLLCAAFVARMGWVVAAYGGDALLHVVDCASGRVLQQVAGHGDIITNIAVHPTLPYVLSASEDLSINLWDWESEWKCRIRAAGHRHNVTMCRWNPTDPSGFSSCSADRTVKVWDCTVSEGAMRLSAVCRHTLEGHTRGVTCIGYEPSGERPHLVSGSSDCTARVWDFKMGDCLQVLPGHGSTITAVLFHPSLPAILTGSTDETVRIWHTDTYRLSRAVNDGFGQVWALAVQEERLIVACGNGAMLVALEGIPGLAVIIQASLERELGLLVLTCSNMGGEVVAELRVDPSQKLAELRAMLGRFLQVRAETLQLARADAALFEEKDAATPLGKLFEAEAHASSTLTATALSTDLLEVPGHAVHGGSATGRTL